MAPPARLPRKGFWGLEGPPPGRPCRALLVGPPGPYVRAVLQASSQVETYDEEYNCEAYRLGIGTAVGDPASALAAQPGSFPCLLGYGGWPLPGTEENGAARVMLSHDGAEADRLSRRDILVGVRRAFPVRKSRGGPRVVTAREVWEGKRGRTLRPARGNGALLVVDPLVMDPGLLPVPANIEPGGLGWHSLTALLKDLFAACAVQGAVIRPCRLPLRDPLPAFVIARLVSKILTAAVTQGARRK